MTTKHVLLFNGDLVVLKDSGLTFQSLHADNSMQQKLETKKNLSGVRVWRQGGFVTVDGLEGYEGSFFHELLSYRKEKRELRKTHVGDIAFIRDNKTHTVLFGDDGVKLERAQNKEFLEYQALLGEKYPSPPNVNFLVWADKQVELAKKDGIMSPEYRYIDSFIQQNDISPVVELIDAGEIQVEPISSQTKGAHNEC